MTVTNYLNEAAFMPQVDFKPQGALAGVLYGQQMDHYDKLMGVTHYLQQLAAQRKGQEQKEFMEAVPNRTQERVNKLDTMRAEQPFIPQLTTSRANAELAKNAHLRATEHSPRNVPRFFEKQDEDKQMHQNKLVEFSKEAAFRIANEGQMIRDKHGETPARQHVQALLEQYTKAGLRIPPQAADPNSWPQIIKAYTQSVAHRQGIESQREKDAAAKERTQITANAHIRAAQEHSKGGSNRYEPNLTGAAEEATIRRDMARFQAAGQEVPEEYQQRYSAAVVNSWNKFLEDSPEAFILSGQATNSQNKEKQLEAQRKLKELKAEFFAAKGARLPGAGPAPRPAAAGGGAPQQTTTKDGWGIRSLD